jgi:F-type H+-transporting ATPase subunit b
MKINAIAIGLTVCVGFFCSEAYASGVSAAEHATWKDFLWNVVNFSILAALLYYYGRKPLATFLSNRAQAIKAEIQASENAKEKAIKAYQESEEKLRKKDESVAMIIMAAEETGKIEQYRAIAEGEQRKAAIIRHANAMIELESKKAMEALRLEAAQQALVYAQKQLEALSKIQKQTILLKNLKKLAKRD